MSILAFDPGMKRMGWAWLEREGDRIVYLNSGVFHYPDPPKGQFQKRRVEYVQTLVPHLDTLFSLTNPSKVVNEIVPAVGSYGGVQMYLANAAITVVQTYSAIKGLPIDQIGATSVHSKFFPKHKGKITKAKLRNAVVELFPELEEKKSKWIGKSAVYEEPDSIAIGAVELGYEK